LLLESTAGELLVLDSDPITSSTEGARYKTGINRERCADPPEGNLSITACQGTSPAGGQARVVLFLDDESFPSPGCCNAHLGAHRHWPGALIADRVLQPLVPGQPMRNCGTPFRFNSLKPAVQEFMGLATFSFPPNGARMGGVAKTSACSLSLWKLSLPSLRQM